MSGVGSEGVRRGISRQSPSAFRSAPTQRALSSRGGHTKDMALVGDRMRPCRIRRTYGARFVPALRAGSAPGTRHREMPVQFSQVI